MSVIGVVAITPAAGGGAIAVLDPGTPPPDPGDGNQGFVNSKLSNDGQGWEPVLTNGSTATYAASAVAGHQKVRLAATSTGTAYLKQIVSITEGVTYTASYYVVAADDISDATRNLMVTQASQTLIAVDRAAGDAEPGFRVMTTFLATASGQAAIWIGPCGPQGGGEVDVTIERPMFDDSAELRDYVASDPPAAPEPSNYALTKPWFGQYDGHALGAWDLIRANNVVGMAGTGFLMPVTGTIIEAQMQCTTAQGAEATKSYWEGNRPHAHPSEWDVSVGLYTLDSSWRVNGTITEIDFNRKSLTGDASLDSRLLVKLPLNYEATEGERLAVLLRNKSTWPNPAYDSVCFNSPGSYGLPPVGDAQHGGLWWGASARFLRGSNRDGSNLAAEGTALPGIGLRVTIGSDVIEIGNLDMDASPGAHRFNFPVGTRFRQTWQRDYARRVSTIWHGFARKPGTSTSGNLIIQLSGSDIATQTLTIPGSTIPEFNWSPDRDTVHRMLEVALPSPVDLGPGVDHTILCYSTGSLSMEAYTLRDYSLGVVAYPRNSTVSSVALAQGDIIRGWQWSGTGQISTDAGASWTGATYAGAGGANLQIALKLLEVAPTIGELS